MEAQENRNKLVEKFQYFSDNPEHLNMSQMGFHYQQQKGTTRVKLCPGLEKSRFFLLKNTRTG
jgi:hypothetical protein